MHLLDDYAYGLWGAVLFNLIFFCAFALAAFRPQTKRDWRSLGAFSGFMVALFAEMFGYPLTIYILTGLLGSRYPVLDPFTHINGHLWVALAGGSPLLYSILHPLSNVFIFGGFLIIAVAWKGIHAANWQLVTKGLYALVRHPQYSGFALTIIGFLIQWPTFATLLTAPILLVMYKRLSLKEEAKMIEAFGEEYLAYKGQVPAYFPKRMMNGRIIHEIRMTFARY